MKTKKIQKILMTSLFLGSFFALGLFFSLNSWKKNLYVEWSRLEDRGPAEDQDSKKLLSLSYEQLTQRASSALFSEQEIIEEGDLIAFYLGNFLIYDAKFKKHHFICQVFPFVEFSFRPLGVHFSMGESSLIVQSPCNIENTELIGPFWLPEKEILSQPEKKMFSIEEKETFVRFYNASITLMPDWFLQTARFFKEGSPDDEFIVHFNPKEQQAHFELNFTSRDAPITVEPVLDSPREL